MHFGGNRGNINGDILIVGEAFGANEERENKPFIGQVGKELDAMLNEAGINPARCYFTNTINKRPPNNDFTEFLFPTVAAKANKLTPYRGVYPRMELMHGIQALRKLIDFMKPKLIITCGNWPMWALTSSKIKIGDVKVKSKKGITFKGPVGITSWRGSQMVSDEGIPVLPIYHPAAILRQWSWRNITVHDLRARVPLAFNGKWAEPERNYIIAPTLNQVMEIITDLKMRATLSKSPLPLAVDIETKQRLIWCIGTAWSTRDALCIPLFSRDNWAGYWTEAEEVQVLLALRELLEHPNVSIIGQNFVYDMQYLFLQLVARCRYMHDTMLAHHVAFPGTPMGLDYLSSMYCEWHCYWKDDGKESDDHEDDMQMWTYNCRDGVTTFEVMQNLEKVLHAYNLQLPYAIQMTRIKNAAKMMLRGTRIDERRRQEELRLLMDVVHDFETFFYEAMPDYVHDSGKRSVWWRSNQQLGEIFYDTLGMTAIRGKEGQLTVDDDALTKIGNREPALSPITNKLKQYRSLKVFGDFLQMKVSGDGRMRTSFSPTTETFRYRSGEDAFGTGRNLQNLPQGAEDEE